MKRFLITAGPTIEPIDPVRYISNYSTGEMGYELARTARKRGGNVTLISGPTALEPPEGVKFIAVRTALEMKKAVLKHSGKADCVIMTAAVADFRPASFLKSKLKKGSKRRYSLHLLRNPDILSELGRKKGPKIIVGYSLETGSHLKNSRKKLDSKNLDIMVANRAGKNRDPFGKGRKNFNIICRKEPPLSIRSVTKQKISHILLDKIDTLW